MIRSVFRAQGHIYVKDARATNEQVTVKDSSGDPSTSGRDKGREKLEIETTVTRAIPSQTSDEQPYDPLCFPWPGTHLFERCARHK